MTKISLLRIVESTTVDGPGLRNSIYCAGCTHCCKNCHNPQSWNIQNGTPTDIEEIFEKIAGDDLCNVTFSGGDPMMQASAFAELAKMIKERTQKTIWCYTGYDFEDVIGDDEKRKLLMYVDVLVDGKFDESQKDETLLFRGSRNQRLIDVKKSLMKGETVEYQYNPFPEFNELRCRHAAVN